MKVLRFFARFVLICNVSFLLFIFFSYLEHRKKVTSGTDAIIEVPFFKNLIVTLGFSAIFINISLQIVYVLVMLRRRIQVPAWLVITNLLFLILQVYYFFFYTK